MSNPRERKLRLRKVTVRNISPMDARGARGGINPTIAPYCVVLDTKDPSQNPCIPPPTTDCNETTFAHTECDATECLTECMDTYAYSCGDSCWDCDSMMKCRQE